MAPDLNSVPPSPRHPPASSSQQNSVPSSRRASQIAPMGPPPLPLASPGGSVPQATHPFPPLSPYTVMTQNAFPDSPVVPVRHPRPMTAAELHLELEKEQEAVVNRLTRELTALRAHTNSVASTTSTASTGLLTDPNDSSALSGMLTGPTHPTPSRRHRSSSSLSRGSAAPGITASHPGMSHASVDRAAAASGNASSHSHRTSFIGPGHPSNQSTTAGQNVQHGRSSSIGLSTARYEEAAHARQELETVRAENEMLRQRVKDLEALLRGRRTSPETGFRGNDSRERGRRGNGDESGRRPEASDGASSAKES